MKIILLLLSLNSVIVEFNNDKFNNNLTKVKKIERKSNILTMMKKIIINNVLEYYYFTYMYIFKLYLYNK